MCFPNYKQLLQSMGSQRLSMSLLRNMVEMLLMTPCLHISLWKEYSDIFFRAALAAPWQLC